MADRRAIGVFDSGLGGLTVARELIKKLPNEDIVYFGDTGRVPYGARSRDIIRKYAIQDETFLLNHNVKLIVAACGTVSSVASDTGDLLPVPFFEVVSHSARAAVAATKNGKIGAIGTAATIKSEQYNKHILQLMPKAQVVTNCCPLFVPLVEEGWYDSDDIVVLEVVKRYLQPMIDAKVDTLILGCTHYPVLTNAIRKVMGDNVTLINSGVSTSVAVSDYMEANGLFTDDTKPAQHRFYVSDKPVSFRKIASILLGEEIDEHKVEQVDISSL